MRFWVFEQKLPENWTLSTVIIKVKGEIISDELFCFTRLECKLVLDIPEMERQMRVTKNKKSEAPKHIRLSENRYALSLTISHSVLYFFPREPFSGV